MHPNWEYQLRFYREFIDQYHWELEPMIQLLEYFNRTGLCGQFYPSNSHDQLGLSAFATYEERRLQPMVYVGYLPERAEFRLDFTRGKGGQNLQEYYKDPFDMALIYRIERWLHNQV